MTNEWFNEYMFRLVVDKQYVPAETLKLFDQKPVMVMPEDPLFQEDM
jgi:bleomycin hydrolase